MTLEVITRVVCRNFGVSKRALFSRGKKPACLPRARFAATYIANLTTLHSFPELGRFFDRNHTTILYQAGRAKALLETDKDFKAKVNKCLDDLGDCHVDGAPGTSDSNGRFHHQARTYKVPTYWCWTAVATLRRPERVSVRPAPEGREERRESQGEDMIVIGKPCRTCGGRERYKDGKCRACKVKRETAARRANGAELRITGEDGRAYKLAPGMWNDRWGHFDDDPRALRREPKYRPRNPTYVPSANILDGVL